MTVPADQPREQEPAGPVIRDKRRIDPETGELRPTGPAGPAESAGSGVDDTDVIDVESAARTGVADGEDSRVAVLQAEVDERTADLQRVSAEFANYKKRVERDRRAVVDQALTSVLLGLLPVLDDVDRARDHGELEGGVKSIVDNLEITLTKLGLERFGVAGEAFDPNVHEAMTHGYADDVEVETCAAVFQPGYRLGGRVLRPARVAVVEPSAGVDGVDEVGNADVTSD